MHILGISGSLRAASTNTALLHELAHMSPGFQVFDGLATLPAFNPDLEGALTPAPVLAFAALIARADGVVISCPEYVHALPGAFKNAVDWLVSRDELIGKPIALIHASHRGDDALTDLRRVLATVSDRFAPDIFARFHLTKKTPTEVRAHFAEPAAKAALQAYLQQFRHLIQTTAT